jgi:glycerol-3-phosphate acyltransferase PlsY
MVLPSILLILFGYLFGSIPTSYIAGRLLQGIDLRQYGSGTVSGSGVYEHVAKWAVVPVGLFDLSKAVLPAWLGQQFELSPYVAAAAGLAAIVGHNWPIFLNFTGGRGIGTMLGLWAVLYWPAALWIFIPLAIGWALGDSAPWAFASLLTLPLFSYFTSGPDVVIPTGIAMFLITIIKRLEANRRPLPPTGPGLRKVLLYRLLLDRDIRPHRQWLERTPDETDHSGHSQEPS